MDAIVQLPHAAQSHLTCGCSDQHNRSALLNVIALGTCLLSLCTLSTTPLSLITCPSCQTIAFNVEQIC